jgi:hypothetical protein
MLTAEWNRSGTCQCLAASSGENARNGVQRSDPFAPPNGFWPFPLE